MNQSLEKWRYYDEYYIRCSKYYGILRHEYYGKMGIERKQKSLKLERTKNVRNNFCVCWRWIYPESQKIIIKRNT